MRGFVARHRLAFFLALAFSLSWYPWIIALVRGTTTGPNPLGPLAAALIVSGISGGFTDLVRRIVRVKVAPRWYAIAIALPILICAVANQSVAHKDVVERFLFIFLFVALGEEPGWRGFLLPELERKFSPAKASLILAAIWSVWHVPLFGSELAWPIVPAFLVSVVGATFVLTWIYHRANDSILIPMILHATVNTVAGGVQMNWWIYSALWLLAGFIASRSVPSRIVLPSPDTSHVLVDLGSGGPRPSGR